MKMTGVLDIDNIDTPFIGGLLPSAHGHVSRSASINRGSRLLTGSNVRENGAAPSLLKDISNLFANQPDDLPKLQSRIASRLFKSNSKQIGGKFDSIFNFCGFADEAKLTNHHQETNTLYK